MSDKADVEFEELRRLHSDSRYLTPGDLAVKPISLSRVALIGSCLLERWGNCIPDHPECVVDVFVVPVGAVPILPDRTGAFYDFQVIQIPLRELIPEPALWHIPYNSLDEHERLLEKVYEHMEVHLRRKMIWNIERGLLTFVCNFMLLQRNPIGGLLRKYDLRNPVYFVQKLNEHLEKLIATYKNTYMLDLDQISASMGRRYVQDDNTVNLAHGSLMEVHDGSEARIERVRPFHDHYESNWLPVFRDAIWEELKALHRVVMQADAVKLVVVDLDDTLWRGVIGEMEEISDLIAEGWPIGVVEALAFLKQRGILLAIISKNEESLIRELWPRIFREKLPLSDFAAIRINWEPKVKNMREIQAGLNVLPRSVLFIDDDPVEREAMKAAFPDIRVLGRYPYYLRRTLLWSPETQVLSITDESQRRTEMIQAQLVREDKRSELTDDEFWRSCSPSVSLLSIDAVEHPRFKRAMELINKTNQFNTTGRRWTLPEMEDFLRSGQLIAFDVRDAFADYGLVGVILFQYNKIIQWVMSCRVLGCKIENAVMAKVVERIRGGSNVSILGALNHTNVNFACRNLFKECLFSKIDGPEGNELWSLPAAQAIDIPPHVTID